MMVPAMVWEAFVTRTAPPRHDVVDNGSRDGKENPEV